MDDFYMWNLGFEKLRETLGKLHGWQLTHVLTCYCCGCVSDYIFVLLTLLAKCTRSRQTKVSDVWLSGIRNLWGAFPGNSELLLESFRSFLGSLDCLGVISYHTSVSFVSFEDLGSLLAPTIAHVSHVLAQIWSEILSRSLVIAIELDFSNFNCFSGRLR